MMKNGCIIFSCTIFSEDRIFVLRRFLETFKLIYSDTDIYIGINHGSLYNIEDIISEYQLNTISSRSNALLYSKSDASGYQVALKLLLESNKEYDYYWFVHTKSGVNLYSDYLREWYIDNFLSDRQNVEMFLNNYDDIESYGMLGLEYIPDKIYNETDTEIDLFKNNITDELPYTHSNFFYLHTIYVLTHKPISVFFKLITNVWFESKLDTYYFEGVFPFIVSRLGYFPYVSNRIDNNGGDILKLNKKWIDDNHLEKYEKYLNLHKSSYSFNQLSPPYE